MVLNSALSVEQHCKRVVKSMGKKRKLMFLICGALLVTITIIFYLLTLKKLFTTPMRWISLLMLLLAEGIMSFKAITIENSIFKVANIITSAVHTIVVLVFSIIFVNLLPMLIGKYILLNILALVALAIVDVLVIYFAGDFKEKSQALKGSRDVLKTAYAKANGLSLQYQSCEFVGQLNKIAEMLRYSDDTVLTGDETTIISELEEINMISDEEEIKKKLEDIGKIIETRTMKVKELQRGSF